MVRSAPTPLVMVKADPPALNTIELTSVGSVGVMFLRCEVAKVAVSPGPFGTVAGVQFAAVFQSLLVGLRFHVALSAYRFTARAKLKTIENLVFTGCIMELRHHLWYDCQREIVPIAAFVVRLKVVSTDGNNRAIGKIAKCSRDRVGGGVADHS
jgi:hypothetical protein